MAQRHPMTRISAHVSLSQGVTWVDEGVWWPNLSRPSAMTDDAVLARRVIGPGLLWVPRLRPY